MSPNPKKLLGGGSNKFPVHIQVNEKDVKPLKDQVVEQFKNKPIISADPKQKPAMSVKTP